MPCHKIHETFHIESVKHSDTLRTQKLAIFCGEPLAVRLRNEQRIFDVSARTKHVAENVAATVAGSYDIALIAPILEQHIRETVVCDAAR